MKKLLTGLFLLLAATSLTLTGCGTKETVTNTTVTNTTVAKNTTVSETKPETKSTFPATEEGAKSMLKEFAKPGADTAALSKHLRPTKADYEAVFDAEFASKAMALYDPAWDAEKMVLTTNDPARTEVILYPSTSDDVKSWTGAAAKNFAGGWKEVAPHLKPGVKIYRFDFVEPGKSVGMVYEGLVNVNGNWRIFPKPWRAVS
jgi:hypothetical protein